MRNDVLHKLLLLVAEKWGTHFSQPYLSEWLEARLSKLALFIMVFSGLTAYLGWPLLSRLLGAAAAVLLIVICVLAFHRRFRL